MSANVENSDLPLKEILKPTGFYPPKTLRDKTFKEATSGGSVSLEDNAEKTINVKSYTEPVEITPAEGKDGMKKATVTLSDIPQLESNRSATIDVSTYSAPVEIEPSSGKDGMEKATVALSNIPQLENGIEETVTENGEVVIEPSEGYDGVKRVTVNVAVPQETVESNKAETIDVSTYASPVEVTPDSPNTVMRKATVSLSNIPQLENNKAQTIDVSNYSAPVEITPTSGKDGMKKATVTLSNIPTSESMSQTRPAWINLGESDAEMSGSEVIPNGVKVYYYFENRETTGSIVGDGVTTLSGNFRGYDMHYFIFVASCGDDIAMYCNGNPIEE